MTLGRYFRGDAYVFRADVAARVRADGEAERARIAAEKAAVEARRLAAERRLYVDAVRRALPRIEALVDAAEHVAAEDRRDGPVERRARRMTSRTKAVEPIWSCVCPRQDVDPYDASLCAYCGCPIMSTTGDVNDGVHAWPIGGFSYGRRANRSEVVA